MIAVWVLVFYMDGSNAGGPSIIDNITSQQECLRVGKSLPDLGRDGIRYHCIEVWKKKV